MHKEILTKRQAELLPLLKSFSKDFGLVGGTAIALHIGHRRSIDFDLFSPKKFGNLSIKNKISKFKKIDETIVNKLGEYTIFINGVKLTFFHYPYQIEFSENFGNTIKMPNLLTLAAMKTFALGMRAKWKDYVDLYFIIKYHFTIKDISRRANKIFGLEFNEKLFRTQLVYFKDIKYTEEIDYLRGFEVSDKIIKKQLTEFSLE